MSQTGYLRAQAEDYEKLRDAFVSEGFDPNIFQVRKEGQIWGGTRILDANNELHVRIINASDGREYFLILESEIEPPREYLEHLSPSFPSEPCYGPIKMILQQHGIPYQVVGHLPEDPVVVMRPTQPTPWKPIFVAAIPLAFIGGLLWLGSRGKK